jgi:thiamine-phosphate pyrophosphorylase
MSRSDCRLYLVSPPVFSEEFPALLASVLDAADVAAFLLRLPGAGAEELARAVARVRPVTVARGVALMLSDPALARRLGCDGAHLEGDGAEVAAARRLLGDDLQLGVFCGLSRDAAMRAGEEGADYVAFGPFGDAAEDTDLLTWWSELMELPVVAEGAADPAACVALARAGADFVSVGDIVWNDPAGPVAAAKSLAAALVAA